MTTYLLDSNVFIQAKNRHYGFDFCPAFWDWLDVQNRAGKVASIEKVAEELKKVEDELATWAGERGDAFFLKPDDAVVDKLRTVSDWASASGYQQPAVNEFLNDAADSWLVVYALAHGCIVVTHEVSDNSKRIKIPDACENFKIDCISPYEMLRREKANFILGPSGKAR